MIKKPRFENVVRIFVAILFILGISLPSVSALDKAIGISEAPPDTPSGTMGGLSPVDVSSPVMADLDPAYPGLEVVIGSIEGIVFAWHKDGTAVSGWPKDTVGPVTSSPAIADLDNDGQLEVVVGDNNGNLYAWHADGTALPGWPVNADVNVHSYCPIFSPAIADINNDGQLEVVISTYYDVYFFRPDGTTLWSFLTSGTNFSSPAIADVNSDGTLDVVLCSYNKIYIFTMGQSGNFIRTEFPAINDGGNPAIADLDPAHPGLEAVVVKNCGHVYAYHLDDGSLFWTFNTWWIYSSPAIADINKDGSPEVVIGSSDRYVHLLDRYGHLIWSSNTGTIASTPAIADLDNNPDNGLEVVVGSTSSPTDTLPEGKVYALDKNGNIISGWPVGSYGNIAFAQIFSSPAVADLDPTYPGLEVVFSTDDNYAKVYALHADGTFVSGWPKNSKRLFIASPAVADLYTDEAHPGLERVLCTTDGEVLVLDADSKPIWNKQTGGEIFGSPNIADINQDGVLEIVVASSDKKIYVWDAFGNEISGWPVGPLDNKIFASPAIANLDPDIIQHPGLEIVVATGAGSLYAYHADGYLFWSRNINGGSILASPTIADLDQDPAHQLEVVVKTMQNVYVLNGLNGNTVSGWPKQIDGSGFDWVSTAVGDLDNKLANGLEVVAGSGAYIYAWYHDGTPLQGWPQAAEAAIVSSPAIGDLDPYTPGREIVAASATGRVYAWHTDGTIVLYNWPVRTSGSGPNISSPAIADIDGNSDPAHQLEVVISSGGKIYAFHGDGTPVLGWPKDLANPKTSSSGGSANPGTESVTSSSDVKIYPFPEGSNSILGSAQTGVDELLSSPAIADINKDGKLEVAVTSISASYTFYLPDDSPLDSSPWPKYLHDEQNTACYTLYLSQNLGDANADNKWSVSDVIYLINYLFKGGPPPKLYDGTIQNGPPKEEDTAFNRLLHGDANDDCKMSVSDVIYLINYLFKGGLGPVHTPPPLYEERCCCDIYGNDPTKCDLLKCRVFLGAQSVSSGTASGGLSSAIKLSDGTQRVYVNGNLNIPATGFSFDLVYNPAQVKIKAVYPTLKTQGFELYLNDDLKGHARIGILKSDGSKLISAGEGSLIDLRFTGDLSSVILLNTDFADANGKETAISIYQATVPGLHTITPYTPTKTTTAPIIAETEVAPTPASPSIAVPSTTTPLITTAPIITQTEALTKEPVKGEIVSTKNKLVATTPALDFNVSPEAVEKISDTNSVSTPEAETTVIPKPSETKEAQTVPKTVINKLLTIPTERAKLLYYAFAEPGVAKRVSKNPIPTPSPKEKPVVVFQVGSRFFNYQQSQFIVIKNRFPGATYRISKNGLLVAYKGNKLVTYLLPVRIGSFDKPLLAEEAQKAGLYKPQKKAPAPATE